MNKIINNLLQNPFSFIGILIVIIIILSAIFADFITVYSPDEQLFEGLTLEGAPIAPNSQFWLGTDLLGRDLFSRLVYGAQTSLIIGLLANGIAIVIGSVVGIVAGYFRGFVGSLMMRFTDLIMAFPSLLLAIVLSAIFKPSLWIVAIVIAMVNWVQIARVIYSETVSIVEKEFVYAEKCIGASTLRILLKHIFPHLLSSIIVFGTLGISTTVLLEATLSYLGVGVQPPTPSWGNIIFENQTYFESAPWLVFFPSIMIILLALGFNLVGDALRTILDPTQRGNL